MILWIHWSFFGCLYICICAYASATFCDKNWIATFDASKVKLLDDGNITLNNNAYEYYKPEDYLKVGVKYLLCICKYEHCMHRCTSKLEICLIPKYNNRLESKISVTATDYDSDNGASLKAVKEAVFSYHHYSPCTDANCIRVNKDGYKTIHENTSKSFFDFIYPLDEPSKFDIKHELVYTVKADENFPMEYAESNHHCFSVENEVRDTFLHYFKYN